MNTILLTTDCNVFVRSTGQKIVLHCSIFCFRKGVSFPPCSICDHESEIFIADHCSLSQTNVVRNKTTQLLTAVTPQSPDLTRCYVHLPFHPFVLTGSEEELRQLLPNCPDIWMG